MVEAEFTGDPGTLKSQDRCHFAVVKVEDAIGAHPRPVESR